MSRALRSMLCLVAGLLPGMVRAGDTATTNAYNAIAARNTFGAAATVENKAPAPAALPAITPNGIMTMGGAPQVLFKTVETDKTSHSYVLAEGDERDGIKVIAIDEAARAVTFDNHGTVQKVALEKAVASNNYVPPPTPAVTPAPVARPASPTVAVPPNRGGGVIVVGNHNGAARHVNGVAPNGGVYVNSGRRQTPVAGTTAVVPSQPLQSGPFQTLQAAPQPLSLPSAGSTISAGATMASGGGAGAVLVALPR